VNKTENGGFEFWYIYQLYEFEKNSLIVRGQDAIGEIRVAESGVPPDGLGAFHLKLEENDFDLKRLRELTRQHGLLDNGPPSTPFRVGTQSKFFYFKLEGKSQTYRYDTREPTPVALEEVEDIAFRLLERVGEGPLRTLTVELSLMPPAVRPGEELKITVDFRSKGKFGTEFRNPAQFVENGPDSLSLNFWTRVKDDSGQELTQYEHTIKLTGNEFLVAERKALDSGEPRVCLKPTDLLRCWTTLRLPKYSPGEYLVELVYYSRPKEESEKEMHDLIVGQYHASLKTLKVLTRESGAKKRE